MKSSLQKIISLLFLSGLFVNLATAQQLEYPEIYPTLPFDLAKSVEAGNSKTTVWFATYTKAEGDESGYMWSNPVIESHQYQRYEYFESKMQMKIQYFPNGDKMWSEEYFYKNDLLSATEKLAYDTLQNPKNAGGLVYLYYKDGKPFQKVTMFGFPNKSVRILDEFKFNEDKKVIRHKSTAVGYGPDMDSLLNGRKDKEVTTIVNDYKDTVLVTQKFQDLYKIQEEALTYYDKEDKLPKKTIVSNPKGEVFLKVDYEYSEGKCSKKTLWISNPKKESKYDDEPLFTIYKVEYFTYENDLISTHIIEENGIQTVFEYSHFTE